MNITDKRSSSKNKSVGNRQKFMERYKSRIKRSVDKIADSKGITDILNDRKVIINQDEIEEPSFEFDMSKGERDVILPGNESMQKGDKIYNPSSDNEEGPSDKGTELDQFSFTLTKEEFLDIYFSDMELPDFIKTSLKGTCKYKFKRTGYSKEGIPPRLDLVKTLKQAMARRIATKSKRYLDDIDMRYKHFTKKPYPVKQATMILLMDVSGSMGEFEKMLAKKFFLLLYLFLNKVYKKVDVIFISHTQEAEEVSEEEFFYSTKSGGTVVSSGLQKIAEIIKERIDLSTTNVYIAQASDGDTWEEDYEINPLVEDLLTKVQYFAYVQTEMESRRLRKEKYEIKDILYIYKELETVYKNIRASSINVESDVYPVLRSLFEKE